MVLVVKRPRLFIGLGQEADTSGNRLLGLPVRMLVDRRKIAQDLVPLSQQITGRPPMFQKAPIVLFRNEFGVRNVDRMIEVFKDPTSEELEDLSLIDRFYRNQTSASVPRWWGNVFNSTNARGCNRPVKLGICLFFAPTFITPPGISYAPLARGKPIGVISTVLNDSLRYRTNQVNGPSEVWQIPPTGLWSERKQQLENVLAFTKFVNAPIPKYPWPNPQGDVFQWWSFLTIEKQKEFVKQPKKLTEEDIRDFITLSLMQHWDPIMANAVKDAKERAKRAKAREVFKKIAFGALGVFTIVAGGAVAVLLTGVKTASDVRTQLDAVEDLKSAADQLRSTDASFASELDRFTFKLEKEALEAEKRAQELIARAEALEAESRRKAEEIARATTPPGQPVAPVAVPPVIVPQQLINRAIQEGAAEGRAQAEEIIEAERSLPTILLVGGGLLVLGVGAYFLLRK